MDGLHYSLPDQDLNRHGPSSSQALDLLRRLAGCLGPRTKPLPFGEGLRSLKWTEIMSFSVPRIDQEVEMRGWPQHLMFIPNQTQRLAAGGRHSVRSDPVPSPEGGPPIFSGAQALREKLTDWRGVWGGEHWPCGGGWRWADRPSALGPAGALRSLGERRRNHRAGYVSHWFRVMQWGLGSWGGGCRWIVFLLKGRTEKVMRK